MIIGIPKEVKDNERRVSLTPYGVSELKKRNHIILIEKDAGLGSGFTDSKYKQFGATLVDNRAMNNLSFEVSREKFLKKGFDFSGDLQRCIIETLELISQKRLNHTL